MKKKLPLLIVLCLVFPLFALLGCGEVNSYPVTVYQSSSKGSVGGSGTYAEGSTVTLTANAFGSHVVAWIYQRTIQIENDETYTITNTLDSAEQPVKSTLTFTMNAQTQGAYTAVFSDGKVMYVKYDNMRLTTDLNAPATETPTAEPITTASFELSQGTTELSTILSETEVVFYENVAIRPEKMNSVLNLQMNTTQHIRASVVFSHNNLSSTFNFRSDIKFQENIEEIANSNHTSQVRFANDAYEIIFKFNLDGQTYYLILTYKSL